MRLRLAAAGIVAALLYRYALPPEALNALGWLALLPLFAAVERWAPCGRVAGRWLGLPFGLVFGFATFHWLTALSPAADMTQPWLLWPGLVFFVLYLSLYPWLFFRVYAGLRRRSPWALLLAPPLWTSLEWLRGSGVLAFSWVHLSQTQAVGGLLAPAGWVGGLGLGFLMVGAQAGAAALLVGRGAARRVGAGLLGGAALVLALACIPSQRAGDATVTVAALQGNVALADKWDPRFRMENLRIYHELGEQAVERGARLLVWPETAFPVSLFYDRHAERALRRTALELGADLITGYQGLSPRGEGGYAYRNAAVLVAANGALEGAYSKVKLLPFGEEIPLADLLAPGLDIDLGQSNFTPGPGVRVLEGGALRCGIFICYEMGFAASARRAAADGAELLVNISNDGWFATPLALELHAALSPMRAAENGLPVLRCGNNGVTEILDARGHLLGRLATDTRDLLVATLPRPARASFYARHGGWATPLAWGLYSLVSLLSYWRKKSGTATVSATGGARFDHSAS